MIILGLFGCGESNSFAQYDPKSSDPIEPARTGALACVRPDTINKHCNTLLRYVFNDDRSSIIAHASVTMSDSVVMSTKFDVKIKARAVCSIGREEYVQSASFEISGRPATAKEAAEIRALLASNIRAGGPVEACMNFAPQPDGFLAETTVNGVRHPELDEPMIWVSPDEGYAVSP